MTNEEYKKAIEKIYDELLKRTKPDALDIMQKSDWQSNPFEVLAVSFFRHCSWAQEVLSERKNGNKTLRGDKNEPH